MELEFRKNEPWLGGVSTRSQATSVNLALLGFHNQSRHERARGVVNLYRVAVKHEEENRAGVQE